MEESAKAMEAALLVQVQIRSAALSVLTEQPCYKAMRHKFALVIPDNVP
jgi:hypothetical protein